MDTIATIRMSSKGQVVIPEAIRRRLNLNAGVQFVVIGEGDVVVLKAISTPSMETFEDIIKEARRQAKAAGLKRADVTKAILKVRGSK